MTSSARIIPSLGQQSHLPVSHLAAHGISPEIIQCWQSDGIETLLPLQVDALTHTSLLRGSNLVVLAPTSSGKTFVGELAAVCHWQAGRKSIFLCPTRALVAEQYRHLRKRYAPVGIRTVMATADFSRHDSAIRRGEFDFAVMVYEKLRAILVMCPEVIYSVGAVVADELQILGDPGRGEAADLLLTRLSHTEPRVQVVGLSAVMNSGSALAGWLDAETLSTDARPAELREGIYCMEHATFHYCSAAHADWTDEVLPVQIRPQALNHNNQPGLAGVAELCAGLARAGENVLLFVPTRALSRQLCMTIAADLGIREAHCAAYNPLRQAEDSLARRQLLECMPAGVAFHNSDLTADLRALVEEAFESGQVQVLVATPTLAQGVNLRARNVVQVPLMLSTDAGRLQQRAAHVPLAVGRYRNQAGRAGRVGTGADYGRSIIVAGGHTDAARLARTYMLASPEPLERPFSDHNIDQFVLECVHAGIATTYSGILGAITRTFTWHSGAVAAASGLEDRLAECVRGLLDSNLLDETSGHRLRITGSGQAMAAGGYRSHTICEMLQWCGEWNSRAPAAFEILCACAFTADGEQFLISATTAEIRANTWKKAARQCMAADGIEMNDLLRQVLEPEGGLSQSGHASLKMVVLCCSWLTDTATAELEERFRVVAGTIGAVAAHLSWLAAGLGACASVVQCSDDVLQAIGTVAQRLPPGLSPAAARLAQLQIPGMSRNYLNLLAAQGFDTPRAVYQAEPKALQNVLPEFIVERITEASGEDGVGEDSSLPAEAPVEKRFTITNGKAGENATAQGKDGAAAGELLRAAEGVREVFVRPAPSFDLVLDPADPGAVEFFGTRLRLPPKPYALLTLLAQRCGHTVSYTSIDEIVWPDEKVEPQQISAHKCKLIRALGDATTREQAEAAIITDPRYGLRLNLSPASVKHGPQKST